MRLRASGRLWGVAWREGKGVKDKKGFARWRAWPKNLLGTSGIKNAPDFVPQLLFNCVLLG